MKILSISILLFFSGLSFAQMECSQGTHTDPTTGRCVQDKVNVGGTEQSANEILSNLNKNLEDGSADEIRKQAQQNASDASTTTKETKDKKNVGKVIIEDLIPTAGALAIGIPAVGAVASCPLSPSAIALAAGAAATMTAEIKSIIEYKKKQKKLEERMLEIRKQYQSIENPTLDQKKAFTANTQAEAFEILALAEDQIAIAASSRKTWHGIASAAYATAGVAAGVEILLMSNLFTSAAATPQYLCPSAAAVAKATALNATANPAFMAHAAVILAAPASSALSGLFTSPYGRMGMAAAAAGYSKILADSAKRQEGRAKDRAKTIREIKMAFVEESKGGSLKQCNEGDRSDPANPQCYCYTPEWRQNPARTESQVCNQHWGDTYTPKDTNYEEFLAANGSSNNCITKDFKDDPRCNCLSNNSCLSLPVKFNLQSFPGISTQATSSTTAANKLFQGKLSEGDMAQLEKGNAAFSQKNIINALAKNPKTREMAKELSLKNNKYQKQLDSQIAAAAKKSGAGSGSSASGLQSPFAGKLNDELKKAGIIDSKVETKINKVAVNKGSAGVQAAVPSFDVDLDFSSLKPGAGVEVKEEVVGANDKRYGSKETPIAEDDGQTIFQKITNRYQESGMRKLFATRKGIKAE